MLHQRIDVANCRLKYAATLVHALCIPGMDDEHFAQTWIVGVAERTRGVDNTDLITDGC